MNAADLVKNLLAAPLRLLAWRQGPTIQDPSKPERRKPGKATDADDAEFFNRRHSDGAGGEA